MKKDIAIIIPCYNEESSIKQTIDGIKEACKDLKENYEIIVVDDSSKDNSKKILYSIKGIKVISHKINKGYGASLKTGILKTNANYIVITDSDGTYPVDKIPSLINLVDDYDMVVGARIGKNVHIPLVRRPAKKFLNKFASYLAGSKIPDLNSGLRIFKKDLALKFFNLLPEKFSFTSTITMAALTNGYSVKYIPINYYKRKGKSSIKVKDFLEFNKLLLKLTMYFNPLKVFLPIGLFLFFIGFISLLHGLIYLKDVTDLPVFLIIASLQIGLIGLVADMIPKFRR